MLDQRSEAPPKTALRDGSDVIIRRLFEEDRAALLAFGASLPEDDRLYLEKYLERPHHIEIQIFADAHGRVVSLVSANAPCSAVTKR